MIDDRVEAALVAIKHAGTAISALAHFARDGIFGFEGDPVCALAEACRLAAQLETDATNTDLSEADLEMTGQLIAACQRYIEHWTS